MGPSTVLFPSAWIEQKAGSTESDGVKSEKSIKWPASKKRDNIAGEID